MLALGVVVIVGIFVISRAVTAPRTPVVAADSASSTASSAAAPASASSSAAVSDASSAASAASVPEASAAVSAASAPAAPEASSSALVVVDPNAMDQAARRGLLTTLIQQGVFTGVQVDTTPPKVGVTPLFQGLSNDLQQQFIATVYAYVNNGATGKGPLDVVDATTGKTIGHYTVDEGFKLG